MDIFYMFILGRGDISVCFSTFRVVKNEPDARASTDDSFSRNPTKWTKGNKNTQQNIPPL